MAKSINNPAHESELSRRLDELYLDGQTVILWEELYLWFDTQKIAAGTYREILRRWDELLDGLDNKQAERNVTVHFKKQQGVYAAIFRRKLNLTHADLGDLAREG